MGVAALITWIAAALAGLYMLAVWLIENDVTGPGAAASRLPTLVVFAHLLLALTGLVVWAAYLFLGRLALAWAACAILIAIMLLGLAMFARWIPVYRGPTVPADGPLAVHAVPAAAGQVAYASPVTPSAPEATTPAAYAIPAEGNFPVAVVAGHGLLAVATFTLVLLSALGIGGS
jgi:hypothetical protein